MVLRVVARAWPGGQNKVKSRRRRGLGGAGCVSLTILAVALASEWLGSPTASPSFDWWGGPTGFGPIDSPPIKPPLENQLGLTLRDAEAAVEVVVIEQVERPTEN